MRQVVRRLSELTFVACALTAVVSLCRADVPVMSSGAASVRLSVYDSGGSSRAAGAAILDGFSAGAPVSSSMTAAGNVLLGGFWGQDLTAPSAVTDLAASSGPAVNGITIAWTSPFSDGTSGDVTTGYFRIKIATYAGYDFSPASFTVSMSTAMIQGETQAFVVSDLAMNVTYYVRVWHCDENFNWSPVSVGATVYLEDVPVPPSSPSNLGQSPAAGGGVLDWGAWTATATVRVSFVQYDSNPLDLLSFIVDFSTYSDFSYVYHSTISAYLAPGATDYVSPALADSAGWYWRVRSRDDSAGNYFGAYSTAAAGAPAFRVDTAAPAPITNLTALTGDLDGDVALEWNAPADDGISEPLVGAIYRIAAATFAVTSALYDSVTNNPPYSHVVELSTTGVAAGAHQRYVVRGILYPGTTWYFAVKTADKAGNVSSWTTAGGLNPASYACAQDIAPQPPPGVIAAPAGSTTIDISWDLPQFSGYDDRDLYWVYRATYSFSSENQPNVTHVSTRSHPSSSFTDTGRTVGTTYYYRIKTLDKGAASGGLYSQAHFSPLSVEASTVPAVSQQLKVTVVYDDRSGINANNYGVVDGMEDADGNVAFLWPKVIGGGVIQNYFVEVSSDPAFSFFSSSATLPPAVSTYSAASLPRGFYHYARVKAKNSDGDESPWTVSDGIYVNRKTVDADLADWGAQYAAVVNSVTVSSGDVLWRDGITDQRTDKHSSSQLDISSVGISADDYNLYLFVAFASSVSANFDGRNFIQVAIDNGQTSTERVLRGLGNKYEDSYVASTVPWEYLLEIVSGNDVVRVEDSFFSNRKYGKYTENNAGYFYEVAVPLAYLGGRDKFVGGTANFTIANFWNGGGADGSVGDWSSGTNSNIVDVVTSTGPNTWNEVSDRSVDYYLAVSFSSGGYASAVLGQVAPSAALPDEPEPQESGISPAPPSALDLILYNIFIDAFDNGDVTNDDISDTNDYGGDFQGVINRADYLNATGINTAYFGPPYKFGGGIWGFNIDDPFQYNPKFGGTAKYIEMMKTLRNHNIKIMNDWVCGQVGSKDSPAAVRNPDFYQAEQFGWGTKQEFAEARAYYLNNMIWAFATCDAFRYDNPKFWSYEFGPEAYEFNRALRKISDRWDPQLFIMGEIPEGTGDINPFTGSNGPMLHGGQAMILGGYKDNWNSHICSWVRPSVTQGEQRTTAGARTGIQQQDVDWKNPWAINPIMMENHDEKRLISRYRAGGVDGEWHQQVAYMTAFTVGVSPILFYGGEVGLEGPYDGSNSAKMDRDGNVRMFPWNRLNESPWSSVRSALVKTLQARANFPELRGDPYKGGRNWYTGGQYDGEVMVYARTGYGRKAIVMINRSGSPVTLTSVGTGDASTLYKDWLTDTDFWTDGSGNIGSIQVNSRYGRILIRGGYDWVDLTGQVKDAGGQPITGAVIDVDGKSHWTTRTDSGGNYSISGDMRKLLTGEHSINCWAQGFGMVSVSTNIQLSGGVARIQNFTLSVDETPPPAPSTLSVKPRDRAAMLFWQPSQDADTQTYLIYRSPSPIPDGSNPTPIFEVFKTFYYDSDLDNKLTNGVTYYYRVRAVDRSGNKSALSNQVAVVPRAVKVKFWLDTRDYAGAGTKATSASIAGGALAFSKNYFEAVALNSNGDGTFEREFDFDDTTFIEYKYVVNGTLWEGNPSASTLFYDGSQGSSNRGELMDDGVPDFEVADEGGGRMTVANVWRYYADLAPRVPSGISVSAGPNVITVGWTKNAEPDMWYYEIERSTWSPVFAGVTDKRLADASKITCVDTNLVNGATYYYRVRAVDKKKNESSWSSAVFTFPSITDITAPAAPAGLAARGLGPAGLAGALISWTANFEGDLAGYNIHRSTESGFTPMSSNKMNPVLISPSTGPVFSDSSVEFGKTYYYKLVAFDDSGNASNSSAVLAVKPLKITFMVDMGGISASNVGIVGDVAPLSWSAPLAMSVVSASTYAVTAGFVSGAALQYLYSYNNDSVREQAFATSSRNREYTVPSSSAATADNWEENPPLVDGLKVYGGANKVYLYWNQNTVSEDIAGYNIYRSVPPSVSPALKINSSPVSYAQPHVVSGLESSQTYYFSIKAADSASAVLESTAAAVAGVFISSPVYVNFGVPLDASNANSPWGDPSRVKMYLAVHVSTDASVWSSSERAAVTGGKVEMAAGGSGEYRALVPLARGQQYSFLFFAQTTSDPPTGLNAWSEYYDTVPDTGTFAVSTSSSSVSPPAGVAGVFGPVGPTRDARRILALPDSLSAGSTIYVFANFGSTPTAPTYIQAVGGNQKVTLYWSPPYGASWTRVLDNAPLGGGESMKAADVVAGGKYRIYVATAPSAPGNFANYSLLSELSGSSFTYVHTGVSNGTTYYYLMRSYDAFSGLTGNNYGILSSTVSAAPSASFIITKIRVNRGAAAVWKAVRKTIAVQEGTGVSAWDASGRSNMTPTGRAVNMSAPSDDATEQEFSVELSPGTSYNFLLFAYSTSVVPGLVTNATYYDTVPSAGGGGMVASTSTLSMTSHGKAWCGPVGPSWDARRLLYVPTNLPSGATLYVYCNFASSPSAAYINATVIGTGTVNLEWTPYGSWGTGGEALKAADVIAGGSYYLWRSSVSASGPWNLWLSTSSRNYTDSGRNAPGDGLGLEPGRTYYYVAVSSDAYGGDFIPNMYRSGAPSFSSQDSQATPREKVPAYFKVESDFFDKKYICEVRITNNTTF